MAHRQEGARLPGYNYGSLLLNWKYHKIFYKKKKYHSLFQHKTIGCSKFRAQLARNTAWCIYVCDLHSERVSYLIHVERILKTTNRHHDLHSLKECH